MRRNFVIDGFSSVELDRLHIDVHNLYRAVSLSTDLAGESATIVFEREQDILPDPHEVIPRRLSFTCEGHARVAFNQLPKMPALVMDIAYIDRDCGWDELLDEILAKKQGCDGITFHFENGEILRILCEEVTVRAIGAVVR